VPAKPRAQAATVARPRSPGLRPDARLYTARSRIDGSAGRPAGAGGGAASRRPLCHGRSGRSRPGLAIPARPRWRFRAQIRTRARRSAAWELGARGLPV